MERFTYEILFSEETPQGPFWVQVSNGRRIGLNLLAALNQLGREGWEIVGTTDVARSNRAEIFLKKKTA